MSLYKGKGEHNILELEKMVEERWEMILKLIGGLRFYADDNSYRSKMGGHIQNKNFNSAIGRDCGLKATQILEEVENV